MKTLENELYDYRLYDDIVNTSLSPGSKISLYTDDMMLFKIINSNADYINGLNYLVTANHYLQLLKM